MNYTRMDQLTWQCLCHWAQERPQAEALVFNECRMTWQMLDAQVTATAKALLELGVAQGDRVAFLGMARPEFMVTFLAANRIGAIWLGLSPKFSVQELGFMMEDCRPKVLVSIREYMGRDLTEAGARMVEQVPGLERVLLIGEPVPRTESFEEFIARPRPHLDAELAAREKAVTPESEALLMYTSGSTGRPKGVVHTHRSIMTSAAVETRQFAITPESRLLLHFPVNHVAADVELGLTAVYAGAALVLMDRFDPVESLHLIERERITMVGQVPAMYLLQMQRVNWRRTDFSKVSTFVWSGAGASRALGEALTVLNQRYGCRLINAYGMTETAGLVLYTQPGDSLETLLKSPGKCVVPFELKLVDPFRREVAAGDIGEIALRGDMLMKGYWNNPEATQEAFDAEGWFYTGDLAWMDENGCLHLAGRKSEMYKSGGENVFPREVEAVLESYPGVLGVAVIGVPDPIYSEVGQAYLLMRPGETAESEALRAHCRASLANFKVPKHFVLREQMPLLPNGKIDKRALRNEYFEAIEALPPRDPSEKRQPITPAE